MFWNKLRLRRCDFQSGSVGSASTAYNNYQPTNDAVADSNQYDDGRYNQEQDYNSGLLHVVC